ncbi:MAG: hypothetical protein M1825_000726 [Sarcosagium campestre]|nr:MAG: hypothetical protein M1825_000726 [Sarcosagium campestre]
MTVIINVEASCHCRRNVFPLELPQTSVPIETFLCHSDTERHISGTLFTSYVQLPESTDLSAQVSAGTTLRHYNSSETERRYFCRTCGAHLLRHDLSGHTWAVALGSLDRTNGVTDVRGHTWVGETVDGGLAEWMGDLGGRQLDRHVTGPQSDLLPLGRDERTTTNNRLSTGHNILRGYCHCGGVRFWVTRPNVESQKARSRFPDLIRPYRTEDPSNPDNEPWWLCDDSKYRAGTCACKSCRMASGFPIATWLFAPSVNIYGSDGEAPYNLDTARRAGRLTRYDSSPGVQRYFCPVCGATAFFRGDDRTGMVDVGVGLLRSREGARAADWLEWWTERVSFEEDAVSTSLVECLLRGMMNWGHQNAIVSKSGPDQAVGKQ